MHHEKNRVVTCITHLILNGNIDLYGGAEFPHPLAPHRLKTTASLVLRKFPRSTKPPDLGFHPIYQSDVL